MARRTEPNLDEIRTLIAENPGIVLDDLEVVRALASAENVSLGENIVDIRSVAFKALETRLERFREESERVAELSQNNHERTVQTQHAVLALLEPRTFGSYCGAVAGPVAELLSVARVKLIFEGTDASGLYPERLRVGATRGLISRVPSGFISAYADREDGAADAFVLREVEVGDPAVYGDISGAIRSEALIRVFSGDLGRRTLLALGSRQASHFQEGMGTDLLRFFGEAFARITIRWIKS